MGIGRTALVVVALAIAGCASGAASPAPVARPAVVSQEGGDGHEEHRVPHSCFGTAVSAWLPLEGNLSPADVVKAPELGPEPPPESSVDAPAWQRPPATALAVARAIETGVPGASCLTRYDQSAFSWGVECKYGHGEACQTTYQEGQRLADGIRAIVTPAVRVSVDTCPCRAY